MADVADLKSATGKEGAVLGDKLTERIRRCCWIRRLNVAYKCGIIKLIRQPDFSGAIVH